jgi:DNA-binding CsgD family transcriptional regulator
VLTLVTERAARERRRRLVPGRPRALLSPREREVLGELRDGASTQEIADRLGLSAITKRRYVSLLRSSASMKRW